MFITHGKICDITYSLLGNTKINVGHEKNGKNVPKWESVEAALVHFYLVNNNYPQASKVLFAFVRNK